MRSYKLTAWFIVLAGLLAAQDFPSPRRGPVVSGGGGGGGGRDGGFGGSTSGSGARSDVWTSADIVLVGELSEGVLEASGARLRCTGKFQVLRVLKGEMVPGALGALSWEFEPSGASRAGAGSPVPALFGIWALKRADRGSFQPLVFMSSPRESAVVGRSFLPLPRTTPAGHWVYSQDAPSGAKIAAELGAALVNTAATNGGRLSVEFITTSSGGVASRSIPGTDAGPPMLFGALLRALSDLGEADAAPVYKYLSVSADPNLQMAGIAGRLRTGDAEAALLLERSAPFLNRTLALSELSRVLAQFPWRESAAATHALARTAIGETELPGLEPSVAGGLGRAGRLEYLPYLAVMLGSPNMGVRDRAMTGICQLLRLSARAPEKSDQFWRPEMQQFCPTSSSQIRDTAQERPYIDYWTQWWAANQQRIPADPAAPRPLAPVRYQSTPRTEVTRTTVPAAPRIEALVRQLNAFRKAMKARAEATNTPPAEGTLLSSRLTREDDKKLNEITLRMAAALDATAEKSRQARNEALVRGASLDPALGVALAKEHDRIVAAGADELMKQMTPQGWDVVVDFVVKMNIEVIGAEPATTVSR